MKSLLAIALLALASPAFADDLVINTAAVEQYYSGTVERIETEGLSGQIVFNTAGPPSISAIDNTTPLQLGIWHITILGAKSSTETIAYCYGMYAGQTVGARLTLDCLPPSSAVKLAR